MKAFNPRSISLAVALLCACVSTAYCQPGSMSVKKVKDFAVTEAIDSTWANAEWVEIPYRGAGNAPFQTMARVLYSETGIYFLIHCEDTRLTATMTQDFDDLFKEDVVEVFLWPDEAHPIYFEYELSPLNYELPIIVPNFNGKFLGWRPWRYFNERRVVHTTTIQGGIKASGATVTSWTAQFFIPFDLLRPLTNVPPTSGTKWRANIYRLDYDNGQTRWAWQPVRTNFHDYEMFGTFIFD